MYVSVLYFFLYRIAAIISVILFWVTLSHTDKMHMRERSRRLGNKIRNSIVHNTSSVSRFALRTLNSTAVFEFVINNQSSMERAYLIVALYILRPVSIALEMITGFTEGVENVDPLIVLESINKDEHESSKEEDKTIKIDPRPNDYKRIVNEFNESQNEIDDSDVVPISTHDGEHAEIDDADKEEPGDAGEDGKDRGEVEKVEKVEEVEKVEKIQEKQEIRDARIDDRFDDNDNDNDNDSSSDSTDTKISITDTNVNDDSESSESSESDESSDNYRRSHRAKNKRAVLTTQRSNGRASRESRASQISRESRESRASRASSTKPQLRMQGVRVKRVTPKNVPKIRLSRNR